MGRVADGVSWGGAVSEVWRSIDRFRLRCISMQHRPVGQAKHRARWRPSGAQRVALGLRPGAGGPTGARERWGERGVRSFFPTDPLDWPLTT